MTTRESDRGDGDDERLKRLFRPLNVPCPEEGFTDAVMRRVGRWRRLRWLVLGSAAVVGLAVSAIPVSREFAALWPGLRQATDSSALAAADPMLIAMSLLLLIAPIAACWLAR